jgi:hypothetical protein
MTHPTEKALVTLIRSLERNVEALEGHAEDIRSLSVYDTQVLGQAHALIGQILPPPQRQVTGRPT